MYKVIRVFKDVDNIIYDIGSEYNNTDNERLELLSTNKNKYGYPFIEKLETTKRTRKKKVVDTNE